MISILLPALKKKKKERRRCIYFDIFQTSNILKPHQVYFIPEMKAFQSNVTRLLPLSIPRFVASLFHTVELIFLSECPSIFSLPRSSHVLRSFSLPRSLTRYSWSTLFNLPLLFILYCLTSLITGTYFDRLSVLVSNQHAL